MKKQVIKLDRTQLRKLISEAIQTREPGSPLWSPENLQEMPNQRGPRALDVHVWCDQWSNMMKAKFDPGDPSMAYAGQDSWDNQVEAAAAELYDTVADALKIIEENLINGEYLKTQGAGAGRGFGR